MPCTTAGKFHRAPAGYSETPPYLYLVPDPGSGRLDHLAIFLEWGSHEAWPNSEGRYISVPKHNGAGISFLPAKVKLLDDTDAPFLFYGGHLGDPVALQRHRMWFGSTDDHDRSDLDPYTRRDNVLWPPVAPPCAGCSWQRPTSDEDAPALWACPSGVATGMNCSGRYCDNVSLRCCTGAGSPSGAPVSTPFFSEEGAANGICPDNRFVTGIRCQGSYCDNMSLSCSVTNHSKGMCSWTPFFSEEWPEHADCPKGSAIAGAKCQGSYCDNVSLLCCQLQ